MRPIPSLVMVMNDLPVKVIDVIGDSAGVIAVWKPAGLATQAPPGIPSAESWLRRELHGESSRGYLGVPHRIDRGVSGVVLFAATPRAARKLSRQFERRQVRKSYLAIVTCGEASQDTVAALVQAGNASNGNTEPASAEAVTWCDRREKIPEEARARLVAYWKRHQAALLDGGWAGGYDSYGRPVPDAAKFPSTAGGAGLRALSDMAHARGLRFGVWECVCKQPLHDRARAQTSAMSCP